MQATVRATMTPAEWGLLLFLSVIWGGSFFFIEIGLTELPPLSVVAARVGGAAILLVVALRIMGIPLPRGAALWGAFLMMGLLNNILPFTLIAWGQVYVSGGLASILNATTPLFTVLLAHYWTTDERMTPARVAGLIVGFAGVVVMVGADALHHAADQLIAELAILVAAALYAVSAVYARRFKAMGATPMVAATGQMVSAAVVLVPLALLVDQPWNGPMPSGSVWGALFGLAFLSTFIAYIVYYRILETAGSVNIMLVTFLVPVTAILLGSFLLGETLSLNHLVGMGAIGIGLMAIDGRPVAMVRRAFA